MKSTSRHFIVKLLKAHHLSPTKEGANLKSSRGGKKKKTNFVQKRDGKSECWCFNRPYVVQDVMTSLMHWKNIKAKLEFYTKQRYPLKAKVEKRHLD